MGNAACAVADAGRMLESKLDVMVAAVVMFRRVSCSGWWTRWRIRWCAAARQRALCWGVLKRPVARSGSAGDHYQRCCNNARGCTLGTYLNVFLASRSAVEKAQVAVPSCRAVSLAFQLPATTMLFLPNETTFTTKTLCSNGTNLKFVNCTAGHNIQFFCSAVP